MNIHIHICNTNMGYLNITYLHIEIVMINTTLFQITDPFQISRNKFANALYFDLYIKLSFVALTNC